MKATCTNPIYFKKILDTISILVEDVNLQCNEKGIFIQGLDPSKVSMFKLILKSSFFETYECNSNVMLGVNIPTILQIMKHLDEKKSFTLKTNKKLTKLKFQINNSGYSLNFTTSLKKLNKDGTIIPKILASATIKITTKSFTKLIDELNQKGDKVNITVCTNHIFLSTDKCPNTAINLDCQYPNDVNIQVNEKMSFDITFSLRFLKIFSKASNLTKNVIIEITKDFPISIFFYFPKNLGLIEYHLAPMVTDCDDQDEKS
ncbi:proliferating cell nuclear antigen [Tritrichomonas musculus]|uniref:DNA sliding clamp PCNA n=1 Tax=Tritrichomonas musculus TaxID=1915356 RepID=A0ABR2HDY7_9EUKA